MVWYVTWYWYEWGMVWVFHSTVWWYWYGAHLPPWNGYPLGALNQGIDVPHRYPKMVTEVMESTWNSPWNPCGMYHSMSIPYGFHGGDGIKK